ncbi:MAG: peptidylprolyl isomerase [Bacteroidales bacterium]|nr:peptidylprolyl isomerase [Bacteroidales bacterium]
MKKQLFIGLAIAFATLGTAKAQSNDPVVMEFAGQKVTKSEFVKSFKQANNINPEAAPTACTYEKRKALEEYVDLYANFRLRLYDAYLKKYDTATALRNEYRTYRNEMALPYLIDSVELENLLHRTYENNKYAVRASHIMVRLEPNATPQDTLKAYNKAMDIYNKVMAGEDFAKLAETLSDDETARPFVAENGKRYEGNHGDIGCFTIFQMVPEFENACYNMKVGDISKPVRTMYGYHIIKLTDKIKAYGKTSLQHIWITEDSTKPENAEKKIQDAYKKLQEGESFGSVVRNYASFVSREQKEPGLLQDLPVNQVTPEYLHELQFIKEGEYTKPFKSPYGWHIVKKVKTEQIPPYEDMQAMYRSKLTANQYNNIPQTKFIEKCKKNYKFTDYTQKKPSLLDPVVSLINDTVFRGKWKYNGNANNSDALCVINGRKYTANDLALFIEKTQRYENRPYDYGVYVSKRYKSFIDRKILEHADSLLELNNEEFRNQMNEFRDGLVIFAYNDQNIWSRATTDTTGLKAFYATSSKQYSLDNPDHAIYFWDERANVTTAYVADSAYLKPSKAKKIAQKVMFKEKGTPEQLRDELKKNLSRKCTEEHPVGIIVRKIEKSDISAPKGDQWNVGVYINPSVKGYKVVCVTELLDPQLKSLNSAKGYYINNYQNELEHQLIESLRKKYNLIIHRDVIDTITW